MIALWDSPERLGSLLWITIVGGIGALAATVCTVAGYFVNDRITALQNIQTTKTITDQQTITTEAIEEQKRLAAELKSVNEKAAELAAKAQDAERGVSDTYDFNGARRQRAGGQMGLIVGEETAVFVTIQKLYANGAWSELRDACEAQIKKTPTWLTPYLFAGDANVKLGDLAKAEERLQFVATKAGTDPAYADAARILAQVRAALGQR
jgi:hypothetical protein